MAEKRRRLPSWMLGIETKPSAGADTATRKRKVKRETVYCMDETELVETALGVLAEAELRDQAVPTQPAQRWSVSTAEDTVARRKLAKPSSSDEEEKSQEDGRRCVSEMDLEGVAEEETVPYVDAAGGDHGVQLEVLPQPAAKGQAVMRPGEGASDDEAFQLLREIFFK
ncbi:hypothetical protein GN956_G17753 [Arapaima gigas]